MKVIFLDIDGVLNNHAVFIRENGKDPLCQHAVARFKALVAATGAKVVLSSTWRMIDEAVAKLRREGILDHAHEEWRTGYQGSHRGRQIADWLECYPGVTAYVILDDDSDMLPEQLPHFVHTRFETGLLDHHCLLARSILNLPATHLPLIPK